MALSVNAYWSDTVNSHEEEYAVTKSWQTASYSGNGIIDAIRLASLSSEATGNTRNYGSAEAFGLLVGMTGTRNLSARFANETYTLSNDLAEAGSGELTISGIKDGDNISTIDANGHSLFKTSSDTTFALVKPF